MPLAMFVEHQQVDDPVHGVASDLEALTAQSAHFECAAARLASVVGVFSGDQARDRAMLSGGQGLHIDVGRPSATGGAWKLRTKFPLPASPHAVGDVRTSANPGVCPAGLRVDSKHCANTHQ